MSLTSVTPKTIIRRQHDKDNPYFVMARDAAQNRGLPYEAIGVLAYLLSQPDDWKVIVADLQRDGCGRDKTIRILKELTDAGHLHREVSRDEKGHFVYGDYVITERPVTENPLPGEPFTDEPLPGQPLPVNPTLQSIDIQSTKKESSSSATLSDLDLQGYRKRYDYYHAFEAGFPANAATKVNDTQSNQNHARDLFLAGYALEEITALVKDKLAQGKADYRFHYLMADLAQARLERNPPAKKAPPGVINAGEKRIPHEWGIHEFARQPAEEGDYD